jgi:hypothetical protein
MFFLYKVRVTQQGGLQKSGNACFL